MELPGRQFSGDTNHCYSTIFQVSYCSVRSIRYLSRRYKQVSLDTLSLFICLF